MIRDRLRRWSHQVPREAREPTLDPARVRVFEAPWVLPGEGAPIREGAVAIDLDDGRVLDCGPRSTLRRSFAHASWVALDGLLLPGFVNAHARLEIGRFEAPRGLGPRRWLRKLAEIRGDTDRLDPASREAEIRASVRRALAAGSAAVGDVTASLRPVPAMGREGLYGVVFHEVVELSPRRAAKALAAAAVQKAGIVPWPEGVRYRLAPDGLGATAREMVKDLALLALEVGAETCVRVVEDDEIALLDAGRDAARNLLGGVVDQVSNRMLLVGSRAGAPDAERLARAEAPVVLCPRTERAVHGEVAPVASLLESGVRIALGTDSPAFAPDGSVLREAAELRAANPEVPALVFFRAATVGGADALGLESMGALRRGRAPGLLHVDVLRTPDDPVGWLFRNAEVAPSWVVRPAPPTQAA